MSAKKYIVDLQEEEKQSLLELVRKGQSKARRVTRARILLLAHDGLTDEGIAGALHTDLVKWQYRGVDHRSVKGIEVIKPLHSNGHAGDFYPIDYRVYAPEQDHKSKDVSPGH